MRQTYGTLGTIAFKICVICAICGNKLHSALAFSLIMVPLSGMGDCGKIVSTPKAQHKTSRSKIRAIREIRGEKLLQNTRDNHEKSSGSKARKRTPATPESVFLCSPS